MAYFFGHPVGDFCARPASACDVTKH